VNCKTCKWFNRDYCRIHAPVRVQESENNNGIADARAADGWPRVDESDFCGEFAAKEAREPETTS
jgi:hypothetical protein